MTIDSVVDALNAQGPAWLWFCVGMRNGDLIHTSSLVEAFRREHGSDLPIRLVVTINPAAAVADLYDGHFASVHVMDNFLPKASDWQEYFVRRELPFFGPGVPLVLHPELSPRTAGLHSFFAQNRVVWGQIYKALLEIPADAEPQPPPIRLQTRAAAEALMADHGMTLGRSLLLFPYAQSFPAATQTHFAALAKSVISQGWKVFTSVAPGEAPIDGTAPLFIPFELLVEVCEGAGWIVALRSGICDIAASADCRKTFFYRRHRDLEVWGVDALDLARDAQQLVFDFDSQSPETFCRRIFSHERDKPEDQTPPLTQKALGPKVFSTLDVDQLSKSKVVSKKRSLLATKSPFLHITNVPRRDHPRFETQTTRAIDTLTRAETQRRYYVCRDCRGGFDYFEEVDASSLRSGRYGAAQNWHAILTTDKKGLLPLLPNRFRSKVLERTTFELGHFQHLGHAMGSPDHVAYLDGQRPLELSGFQLISGWYDLEPWGVWSKGDVSRVKFSVGARPTAPVTLELDAIVIVTQPEGVLDLRVRVNGEERLRRCFEAAQETQLRITIPPELMQDLTAFIELGHPGVRSPLQLGHSQDGRRMALGLSGANLRYGG